MEVREFRAGVRAWIDEVAEPLVPAIEDQSVEAQLNHQRRVQRLLFDAGWMRWGWPERIGGLGGSPILRAVLGEELTSRALVHTTSWSMHEVLGPAVAEFGRPDLVEDIFPLLLRGEEFWCQGFSEPDAGSDLGSMRTTARHRSDGWVINGEKLWTSLAHHATRCVVLARTGARRVARYQRLSGGHGHPGGHREPIGNDGRRRRILLDVVRRRRGPPAASAR